MPSTRNLIAYISEEEIDGTQTGTFDVTTTQNEGVPFHPLVVEVSVVEEEHVLTPCIISIGTNSPDFNNIVSSKSIGGILGLSILDLAPNAQSVPANTLIKGKVNVAAIPELFQTATQNFKVALMGFDVEF
jgi:hypothetical protein